MTELTDSAHWTILSSFLDTPPRMSSPLARPLPGEPRYFVKRSPGGVSPAKMMSREEAAEMMMRTEFSAFSRGADADASAATPEKRPESPRATRAADTDKVAARLVAAANARAENAERRAFETEGRAAARVADAEHDARQAADALGDARRVIAELEHHVAETAMRRDERTSAVRSDDGVADAERASAVAEANRRRLAAELEVDELKAKLEEAATETTATRDAARRALEAREKDARASDEALRARIVEIETAFARERESRTKAEATAQEHERRRIRAIERLLERTARRDEPSALRAAPRDAPHGRAVGRIGPVDVGRVNVGSAELARRRMRRRVAARRAKPKYGVFVHATRDVILRRVLAKDFFWICRDEFARVRCGHDDVRRVTHLR